MSSTTTSTSNSSPVPKKDLEGSNSRSGSRLNHHSSSSPFHQGSFRSSSPQPPGLAADLQANGDQPQPRNVIHIVTKDFPQYFAIVSRPRQDIATVGPEGAILASLRVPKAQVYHKPKYAFTFFIITNCVSSLHSGWKSAQMSHSKIWLQCKIGYMAFMNLLLVRRRPRKKEPKATIYDYWYLHRIRLIGDFSNTVKMRLS